MANHPYLRAFLLSFLLSCVIGAALTFLSLQVPAGHDASRAVFQESIRKYWFICAIELIALIAFTAVLAIPIAVFLYRVKRDWRGGGKRSQCIRYLLVYLWAGVISGFAYLLLTGGIPAHDWAVNLAYNLAQAGVTWAIVGPIFGLFVGLENTVLGALPSPKSNEAI